MHHRSIVRTIGKPVRQAASLYHRARYDWRAAIEEQNELFRQCGLSRNDGAAAVEQILRLHPDLASSMQSEHHVLFGAISAGKKVARILEIGTFDGRGTAMLANLFPNAQIDSIDLPDDHSAFKESYHRKDDSVRQAFIKKRNERLGAYPNVSFEQLNSVSILNSPREKYDLIWVDGDHGYPTVAIDIVNAIRLLSAGGLVLCDDVTKTATNSRHGANSMYASIGAFQTLNALANAGVVKFTLVFKRLTPKANADPHRRKFIAVCSHAAAE